MKNNSTPNHFGDVSWCECDCHTKGSPHPECEKCYGNTPSGGQLLAVDTGNGTDKTAMVYGFRKEGTTYITDVKYTK